MGSIPLTVIGGYLGAGKTTLVNHLLRHAGGRRIAVIVNDFGSLAIDADLLAGAERDGNVIGLANGCVCCSVGDGLHDALEALTSRPSPPDHIVIEVSGVADPAAAAAWATVAPFEPAGVIVLADATTVEKQASDRYVGGEVRRQLVGADLIVVTKTDLCSSDTRARATSWLDGVSPDVPQLEVVGGIVPVEVVLGLRPDAPIPNLAPRSASHVHGDQYVTWSWTTDDTVSLEWLESAMAALPANVLRAKGIVRLDDGSAAVVQRVGRRLNIHPNTQVPPISRLVAIAVVTDPPTPTPSLFATVS